MKFFFEFSYILGYTTMFFGIITGYHIPGSLPYAIMLLIVGWMASHQARKFLGN